MNRSLWRAKTETSGSLRRGSSSMKRKFLAPVIVACGVFLLGQATLAAEMSQQQRRDIEAVIKDYLIRNPEVIKEALEELERRQSAAAAAKTKQVITARGQEIFRTKEDLVLGNPDGKISVVEFFDYNCGYCKRALPEVSKLIESDKDVRVVIKEFPILGPASVFAAKAALASRNQGKYVEFHDALTGIEGVKDEASVMAAAQAIGLDIPRLKADMETEAVADVIRRNYSLAEALSINGTPSFVIDETLEPGYVSFEVLAQHVSTVRQNGGCKVC
jgi:protein-disulfide isomerase